LAIDPQDKNLDDLTKNSESASKSAKNASNAANRAAKSAKEAAESSKQSASFTEESSKTVVNLVSENSSAIRNLITTVREENQRIETQETETNTNQETPESETPEAETQPVVDAISTLLPNLNSYINAQSGVLDAMENDLNYQKESLVLFGGMDKVNKKLLDVEIEANKSQKIALLKQEQILLDQLAEFEKMREELSPEDQLKVQKQLSDAITNLSKKKEEVKSRGEELETARKENRLFKRLEKTFEDLSEKIANVREKTSLVSKILLGVFLVGLAIYRGLISPQTIGKILGFILEMLWEGIKVLTSIVTKLIYMAVDGFFSWLESTFIGSLIKGFGVLGGVLNIFKIFGKLSGPLAALSTGINYAFGIMGKIIGYVFKILSFLPTIGNFFAPLVNFFGFIAKLAPLAKAIPVVGQILTIVFAVVDAIRGFVRGFSGPDGSFMKGLRGALSMIISGLTFGLLDFDIIDGFLADFFGAIGDFFVFLWDNISAYYNFLWNVIKAPFVAIGEFFSDFWKIIWDSDKTLTEKIGAIFDAWMSAISNMFANIWKAIKNFGFTLIGIWKPITLFFMDIVPMIWDYVKTIPGLLFDGLKFMFMDFPMMIWDYVKTIPRLLFDGLKFMFMDFPIMIWDGIKSIFSSIFSAAKDIFGTAVSWISDTIFSLVKSVGNIGKAIWNSLMGLVKGVLKAILDYVPNWAIPQSVYDFVYGDGGDSPESTSTGSKSSSPTEVMAEEVSQLSDIFSIEMTKITEGFLSAFAAAMATFTKPKEEEKSLSEKMMDYFGPRQIAPTMSVQETIGIVEKDPMHRLSDLIESGNVNLSPNQMEQLYLAFKEQKEMAEAEKQQRMVTAITNTNNNVVNNNYAGETVIRPTKAVDPSSSRLRSRHTI
jgi:phage-related protein